MDYYYFNPSVDRTVPNPNSLICRYKSHLTVNRPVVKLNCIENLIHGDSNKTTTVALITVKLGQIILKTKPKLF